MELTYEELTYELMGCFFDVHNSLGVGYDEPAYHKALQWRFAKRELSIGRRNEKHSCIVLAKCGSLKPT